MLLLDSDGVEKRSIFSTWSGYSIRYTLFAQLKWVFVLGSNSIIESYIFHPIAKGVQYSSTRLCHNLWLTSLHSFVRLNTNIRLALFSMILDLLWDWLLLKLVRIVVVGDFLLRQHVWSKKLVISKVSTDVWSSYR